ncbi:MAG: alpha/beta hydrolase [Parvibaculaceae bacterium]|nr:alpha/beta hydrolase [Parvibaculaceae bacterium]
MYASPAEKNFHASGARIAYFEWGNTADPAILLIHATGFHARVWDQTVAALPAGYRIIAVDLRGHGRSEKTGPLADWRLPAADVSELVTHLGLRGAIGVGHSMGGHCLVQVAARHPECFSRLLLVDPVMIAPELYDAFTPPASLDHPVARRRNQWASWQEMENRFEARMPYSLWKKEVLADYCRYGLEPDASGEGFVLACPPAIEASVYLGHASKNIYPLAAKIEVPVVVLRAKEPAPDRDPMDFSNSPTWKDAASVFPHGRDVPLPRFTHFIPMQDPELTARYITGDLP